MNSDPKAPNAVEARRRFLAACGKFAVATPPAVALMLSTASYAVASGGLQGGPVGPQGGSVGTGGRQGNNGFGNGGGDGAPGNSGSNPSPNATQKQADQLR